MLTLDVFKGDGFSMMELTASVNKVPYVPGRLGRMGLFTSVPQHTRIASIEEDAGVLSLIPTTPYGAPPTQSQGSKRKLRYLEIPRRSKEDKVQAAEVQGLRAFGKTELETAQEFANKKLATLARQHDATQEYSRIGAVKGIILDADGTTTLYNLFTEFGVTQTSVDFVLGTATTEMLPKCYAVSRAIEDELGVATYDHIHVICGKTWFERFTTHPIVKDAYHRYQESAKLRNDSRSGFEFGELVFEEYRGKVGGVSFVADSEAHAFPVGVPELFISVYAPGDFLESANTLALPRYSKIAFDTEYNRWMKMLVESNYIDLCTRPKTLVKLTTSN